MSELITLLNLLLYLSLPPSFARSSGGSLYSVKSVFFHQFQTTLLPVSSSASQVLFLNEFMKDFTDLQEEIVLL